MVLIRFDYYDHRTRLKMSDAIVLFIHNLTSLKKIIKIHYI